MKHLFAILLAVSAFAADEKVGPWNLSALKQTVPKMRWLDQSGPVHSLLYAGEKYQGHDTEVFAFYASPMTLGKATCGKGKFPGVVLIHGGGGTAFAEWVWLWAQRGYAAIAMDLAGHRPPAPVYDAKSGAPVANQAAKKETRTRLPNGGPDQGHGEKFDSIGGDTSDDWPFHAVAAVMRAHSLLRSFEEVDAERTAVTGISWGGYTTCLVASLDDRFKAAVPVYGCGFLFEGESVQKPAIDKLGERRDLWIRTYDPSRYLPRCRVPILFVNGSNDIHYPLDSYQKSFDCVPGPKQMRIEVNMRHGHAPGWTPKEIGLFIDSYCKGGTPLPSTDRPLVEGNRVRMKVHSVTALKQAALHYTTDTGPRSKRKWQTVPAQISHGVITAPRPPADANTWFITVTDERDAMVSSTVQFATATLGQPADGQRYLQAAVAFADRVLADGRDKYGRVHSPLFVDGLHVVSLEPVRWKNSGKDWVLSNFASQQPLMRLLDGLTAVTGEAKYRQAAEEAARYVLENLRTPNGLLYWGGHLAWDLEQEKAVGQGADTHELKNQQPYFELLHRVNRDATRTLMQTIWGGHILDWSLLDYNRHASASKPSSPLWTHEFRENVEVPFPAKGGNLSFCNVTPPLTRCGVMLALLEKNAEALKWTRRLLHRWQQGRNPRTGLCGGQLSYRKEDRAQAALGHVYPHINEAQMVAAYHQVSRYHNLPLAQMQAAETLMEAGADRAGIPREFVQWAADDLKTYFRRCFDERLGQFIALLTDGTRIDGKKARAGYYVPESFAPQDPDGFLFWSCAMAYRLTRDEELLQIARRIAHGLGLGNLDQPDTDCNDWRAIYALLELHRATERPELLRLACRVADNLLKTQTPTGLFPRPARPYARTGDEIPLALLHLAATLDGRQSKLPQPVFDRRFFHCEYHGPLEKYQQKRDDKRTYDHLVFYGDS